MTELQYVRHVAVDKYLLPLRSGLTAPPLNTLTNPKLPMEHYIDMSLTWDIMDQVHVSGGVNNMFDRKPPIAGSSAGYGNTWPERTAIGSTGEAVSTLSASGTFAAWLLRHRKTTVALIGERPGAAWL